MANNLRNVIQLGVGFLFILSAFDSCAVIEQTVVANFAQNTDIDKHDGYVSGSIIYAFYAVGNFVAAPTVALLGVKWTIVTGACTYLIMNLAFLRLTKFSLYASSVLGGIGAALFWTAEGNYLAINSTQNTAAMHSGIFWAISQGCMIIGGVFLFFMFRSATDYATLRLLYLICAAVSTLGVLILASLRTSERNSKCEPSPVEVVARRQRPSYLGIMAATAKLAVTRRFLCLIPAFAFNGLLLSFWGGVYPTCIASTLQLDYNSNSVLALNGIAAGLGQTSSGLIFSILSRKWRFLSRRVVILLGAFATLVAFAAIFSNIPAAAPLGNTDEIALIRPSVAITLICGFLLGFADSIWNTQQYAFLIARYSHRSAQAFSIFKFFRSLFASAAFYYSRNVSLHFHLAIVSVTMCLGVVGYCVADAENDKPKIAIQPNLRTCSTVSQT